MPVLIGGQWRAAKNPAGTFSAVDPSSRAPLDDRYPVSGIEDVELACQAAQEAVATLRSLPKENVARFLDDYAARIESGADALVELAARETALPVSPRLRSVELPRTTKIP
jgi:2,5-dioxopentanoate dehydrogenase